MGFAVIPIIFTIADDAFSSVPANLTAGSLALGASRWQTALRVVLPTASPGVFSAIMIGFGRAVGETMIVLMATGNTPVLDWSIFNGMRTLSANIAVEIPEAPYGGTLYRVLFLAARPAVHHDLRRQHHRRGDPAAPAREVSGTVTMSRPGEGQNPDAPTREEAGLVSGQGAARIGGTASSPQDATRPKKGGGGPRRHLDLAHRLRARHVAPHDHRA